MTENPFKAPLAVHARTDSAPVRWRIVPATLSIVAGGVISLYGICMLFAMAYFANREETSSIRELALFLFGGTLATLCGVTLFAAGVLCQRSSWRSALVLWGISTVAAVGFAGLVVAFPNG